MRTLDNKTITDSTCADAIAQLAWSENWTGGDDLTLFTKGYNNSLVSVTR